MCDRKNGAEQAKFAEKWIAVLHAEEAKLYVEGNKKKQLFH